MFNFYDWRFYDSICAFYILRNLERPKIWTGPIPRPVSVLDIERDRDRDWSRFWILNGTDTKTGLGSEHWTGPIPRPGIRAQKIRDDTDTESLARLWNTCGPEWYQPSFRMTHPTSTTPVVEPTDLHLYYAGPEWTWSLAPQVHKWSSGLATQVTSIPGAWRPKSTYVTQLESVPQLW